MRYMSTTTGPYCTTCIFWLTSKCLVMVGGCLPTYVREYIDWEFYSVCAYYRTFVSFSPHVWGRKSTSQRTSTTVKYRVRFFLFSFFCSNLKWTLLLVLRGGGGTVNDSLCIEIGVSCMTVRVQRSFFFISLIVSLPVCVVTIIMMVLYCSHYPVNDFIAILFLWIGGGFVSRSFHLCAGRRPVRDTSTPGAPHRSLRTDAPADNSAGPCVLCFLPRRWRWRRLDYSTAVQKHGN